MTFDEAAAASSESTVNHGEGLNLPFYFPWQIRLFFSRGVTPPTPHGILKPVDAP